MSNQGHEKSEADPDVLEPVDPSQSADEADARRNDEPQDEEGAETSSPFASEGGELSAGPGDASEPDEPAREM